MTDRTQCLSVLRLKPGMRLARALHRPDGAVLMAEDTELTETQLEQLQQRGVDCVFVRQPDPRSPDEVAHDLASAEERIAYLFRIQSGIQSDADAPGWSGARDDLKAALLAYRQAGWLR